jgi:hypothetical protein
LNIYIYTYVYIYISPTKMGSVTSRNGKNCCQMIRRGIYRWLWCSSTHGKITTFHPMPWWFTKLKDGDASNPYPKKMG